ncbi:hypothetical protein, partial [Chelativorans xinjiangense]|uniref:hypothetical protein n=1 Tax=Chelativorans xinjiangense TaxID=2681485 RepID=UPI001915D319
SRSWVSQSAEIAAQQAMAMDLARDECGSDAACVERVANDAFSAWAEREQIKELAAGIILSLGGGRGSGKLTGGDDSPNRTQLIDDLVAGGTKITPENVVDIRRLPDGRTVWLETGNNAAGLQHINRHADEFAQKGISQEQIPDAVFSALEQNKVVGYQGSGTGRPIYEVNYNGQTKRIAITVGDNGFIVGANPTSVP